MCSAIYIFIPCIINFRFFAHLQAVQSSIVPDRLLTSHALLFGVSFCGTIPDIPTERFSFLMFFIKSTINFAILSGVVSELKWFVPTCIITWFGLFSPMHGPSYTSLLRIEKLEQKLFSFGLTATLGS